MKMSVSRRRWWGARYLEGREVLNVLNRYCSTTKVSEEAKEKLHQLGCKVLGYNCSRFHRSTE